MGYNVSSSTIILNRFEHRFLSLKTERVKNICRLGPMESRRERDRKREDSNEKEMQKPNGLPMLVGHGGLLGWVSPSPLSSV